MAIDDLIPRNPIESIAQIVQDEYRKKVTKDLVDNSNSLGAKRPRRNMDSKMEEYDIMPSIPILTGFENRRSVRAPKPPPAKRVAKNESEDPSQWVDNEEETDVLAPIEDTGGAIYNDFPDGTPGETPMTAEESAFQLALAIRKGHEKGRPDIDWHLVKLLYVYGGWSYSAIANECNIAAPLISLHARKGRWVEARESYRTEQASKVAEKLALEEDRLRDWQIMKRRQAGIDGLAWFAKAVSNLRDDASPESLAKLGGLIDRMLSSVTGLTPVEQAAGSVNVKVENNNLSMGNQYPANSPQAKMALAWEKKPGEGDDEHTRRIALVIRDMYMECERAGLYAAFILEPEQQRQNRLKDRLGISEVVPVNMS